MNKVILIGRLTRDPEMRTTSSGISMTRFTIAVSRPFNTPDGNGQTDFISCITWRRQAENVAKYCSKGSQVAVEGRIQTRTYDDQNGQKRYITEVVADNVEFLGSKNSSNNSNTSGSSKNEPTPYDFKDDSKVEGTDVDSNPFADFGSSIEISDDELPF